MYICTRLKKQGSVVQLVRIRACHARGRGFESRPDRQQGQSPRNFVDFFYAKLSVICKIMSLIYWENNYVRMTQFALTIRILGNIYFNYDSKSKRLKSNSTKIHHPVIYHPNQIVN